MCFVVDFVVDPESDVVENFDAKLSTTPTLIRGFQTKKSLINNYLFEFLNGQLYHGIAHFAIIPADF